MKNLPLAQSTKESIDALNSISRPSNLCCILSTDKCNTCEAKICKVCEHYIDPKMLGTKILCRLCYIKKFLPYQNHPRITFGKSRKG